MIPLSRPMIGLEERLAVDGVLRSGDLTRGPKVREFETAFAAYVGVDHAVAVGSGTTALHVGMLAAGVGPGDRVIVPSFTFAGTANAVCQAGASPVFADINPATFCVDAATVAPLLDGSVKAVVAVHLYGRPAPLDELAALCAEHNVLLIEDAAQAPGAKWGDLTVGSVGAFGAFSFYATKNMTTGEGGMLTTNDSHLAETARILSDQGMSERYRHDVVGLNGRLTSVAAALGMAQLPKLDGWNARRAANAAEYDARLDPRLGLPQPLPNGVHVYHQYTIRPPSRASAIAALEDAGIGYGIYYPAGVHQQPAFRGDGCDLPETERVAESVLSIPVRPDLTPADLTRVVGVLNRVAE